MTGMGIMTAMKSTSVLRTMFDLRKIHRAFGTTTLGKQQTYIHRHLHIRAICVCIRIVF